MADIRLSELQKAFALAHKAQENEEYSLAVRDVFRAIAHHIWVSAGKPEDQE